MRTFQTSNQWLWSLHFLLNQWSRCLADKSDVEFFFWLCTFDKRKMKFSFTVFRIFFSEETFGSVLEDRHRSLIIWIKIKSIFKENLLTLELSCALCVVLFWEYLEQTTSPFCMNELCVLLFWHLREVLEGQCWPRILFVLFGNWQEGLVVAR